MPAWVKDEGAWKKAKQAAAESKGKDVEDLGDGDWGLVTHIYQQMTKTSTLDTLQEFLHKARRRLSDENPDYSDYDESNPNPDSDDYESDSDDDAEGDAADEWLKAHEKREDRPDVDPYAEEKEEKPDENEIAPLDTQPEAEEEQPAPGPVKHIKPAPPDAPEYSEYEPDEDEEAHQAEAVSRPPRRVMMGSAGAPKEDEFQPSPEELVEMRQYTRPWEERLREKGHLEAEAHKNPISHKQGRIIEARNKSFADYNAAYADLKNSDEFKNASRVGKMRLEQKFKKEFREQNPEHMSNALKAHNEAHKKGEEAKNLFAQAKDEKIRHIGGGGVQPGAMSLEEGLQHAGGSREDEDSAPSGIQQDKGAAFAAGNQEFMRQYMQNYEKRGKKFTPTNTEEFTPEARADAESVLGEHPALKMPAQKKKFDRFMERYYPLIINARKHVLKKLGLEEKAKRGEIDEGLLDFAGTHALYQAVNDYDHEHPKKASFKTHLNRKMHGLMQTALKTLDEIPPELRAGAKKFDEGKRTEMSSPVKHTNAAGVTTVIQPPKAAAPKRSSAEIAAEHHPDVQDRLKRIAAAKAPLKRKATPPTVREATPATSAGPKRNVNYVAPEPDEDESFGPSQVKSRDYAAVMPKKYTGMQGTSQEQATRLHNKKGGEE